MRVREEKTERRGRDEDRSKGPRERRTKNRTERLHGRMVLRGARTL